ncbi:hypothetical protein L2D08_18560 [Domibacillus sp. PGB-M46]|nr:hypothetical protein [Domibacillus sp. PGB-M46]MCI2256349.1 hypothetical protein [Domibacillus sp. PGB-M46]
MGLAGNGEWWSRQAGRGPASAPWKSELSGRRRSTHLIHVHGYPYHLSTV